MRIVALTDIHAAYDLAVRILKSENPDLVIVGGDLTTVGSVREAGDALARMMDVCARCYCVAGNMDLPTHDDLHVRLGISLNGRGVVVGETGICGVSGAPISPLHTPYELDEEEIDRRIRRGYEDVKHLARTIVVPHAPPFGTKVDIVHSGIHVGSMAVREFIEDCEPDVVICGHIHESRGQDAIGRTKIVNCGSAMKGHYAYLEIGDGITIENRTLRC
jgi:Icc-related predicted phosphoesterase